MRPKLTTLFVIAAMLASQNAVSATDSANHYIAPADGDTANFYVTSELYMEKQFAELEAGKITKEEFEHNISTYLYPKISSDENFELLKQSEQHAAKDRMYDKDGKIFGAFNARELKLFASSPGNAIEAKRCAKIAEDSAKKHYEAYTLWQGNGDAFRHAYWSALMDRYTTKRFAYLAGYAHENVDEGSYDKISDWDIKMDLSNNHRGRNDEDACWKLTQSDMEKYILKSVNDGKKVRIRTWTSDKKNAQYIKGVPTKRYNKLLPTSDGGRK